MINRDGSYLFSNPAWLDEQVAAGGYGTASEYVRDLLRTARLRQQRRAIDGMLVEAVKQGADIVMDDADWAAIRKAARSQAAKRGRKR